MDTSDRDQGQPQTAPPAPPALEEIPPIDPTASMNVNGNGIPQFSGHLLNPMNPEALTMLANPSLMADPSIMAMQIPMADPSFMMQSGMGLPNGQNHGFDAPVAPPATVSAGKFCACAHRIIQIGVHQL